MKCTFPKLTQKEINLCHTVSIEKIEFIITSVLIKNVTDPGTHFTDEFYEVFQIL